MNRRQMMIMSAAVLGPRPETAVAQQSPGKEVLPLDQYEPKSMLHTRESSVPRARYPVIDFHTHIVTAGGPEGPGKLRYGATAEECLSVMDRKNIRTMVNLTGGYGDNLREAIAKLQNAHPGRFVVFVEPAWSRAADSGYPKLQADLIKDAHGAGAKKDGVERIKAVNVHRECRREILCDR